MEENKRPTITLAIIAKNEEKGLRKAVESCRGFVDEVIISVDLNSNDETHIIAKEVAGKVVTHEWKNSFAGARNSVLPYIKTDWILWLDGHEYVKAWGNLEHMLQMNADTLFIRIIMESGFTFYYPRITRKNVRWLNSVHNTPISSNNLKYEEFIIVHDRINLQSKEGATIRERQRTEMIESQLGPIARYDKKDARSNFYMGNLYLDKKEYKKAIKYYLNVAKYGNRRNQKWLVRFHLAICYNELKKPLWALWHLWKAEKEQPNRWEIAKMLGTTYALIGWYSKAIEHWVDSFKINTGKFTFSPLLRNDAETWDFISLAFAQLGRKEEMNTACKQALREERENGPGLLPPEKLKILKLVVGGEGKKIDMKQIIEVCFLTYQRPGRVPKILEQLKAQTIQNFNVNIWNNSKEEIDISGFPSDRIQVIDSKENIGSQARFRLAKKTKGNPIIFFDDDQDLSPYFVEYNYQKYLQYGKKTILGWFTRTFNKEKYWKSNAAMTGKKVDYIATKAMILDREIIDKEPLLQNIPAAFAKVEDLYLCYLARAKYQMKMIRIDPYTTEIADGYDQYPTIDKEKAFSELRKMGWWLLKDGIKKFGGLLFHTRQGVWDEQILIGETNPSYYNIPANPKVVVDIGAHIGGTAILAASMGAEVFAYEPERDNFNLLLKNIKLNGLENKIHCFKQGVGIEGKQKLYLNPKNSGMGTQNPVFSTSQEIDVIGIKQVFEKIEHCDLLKIDCEGAEYDFLRNAPFEKIENISLELHTGQQREMINFLQKYYEVKTEPAIDGTSLIVFCTKK